MNKQFSFIILTFNEEMHLPRLLRSISDLDAPVFILDSGSNDHTLQVAEHYGATVLQHQFVNHPLQWDHALKTFAVATPWIICLDADQVVTPELHARLLTFNNDEYRDIDGIYFNRKNYFKGKWIKHGGYYPFYLLKMIRYGNGYSDTNENMDHRFIVSGKTAIWKDGYILEENLKENNISFWIAKHNRYSDLVAHEEVERMQQLRLQTLRPNFWGTPDERTARLKQVWWQMPRYVRPFIYFIYRMVFQLGFLDGKTGIIFHFLQAFWFRLIVDVKIDEILNQQQIPAHTTNTKSQPLKFAITFIIFFLAFYYFNIYFFGITTPTNHHYYSPFLANNLNYISWLRSALLTCSAQVLNWLGYTSITDNYDLLTAGRGKLILVYSCLGLGVISFFSAFVLSYPRRWRSKLIFLIAGILGIEALNVLRFVLLAIFWRNRYQQQIDHHTIFNIFIYIIIAVTLYFWMKRDSDPNTNDAAN